MRKSNMRTLRHIRPLAGVSLSASALAALLAPAMVNAAAAPDDSGAKKMTEEVVVTARRRSENLERVPIAVSAIGGDQLASRQVKSDEDLQFAVPGLTIRQTQGNNSLTYSIRGQSADTFSGSPSAVVAYIDEVPLTISGASTFYDLASIQVLKGPQGTLFGRNTTGGAVLYTTAKPTNEHEGKLRYATGTYNLQEIEGMVNIPFVEDKLLFRAAFDSYNRDGYIDNIVTGRTQGDIGRDSGRVTLTVKPTDRLENTTMFSYSRTDGSNTGATYVYSIYTLADNAKYGRTLNTNSSFLASAVEEQKKLGYYKTQYPYPTTHKSDDEVAVNTTTFDINDSMRIKNILGYTAGNNDSEQPAIGTSFVTFATRNIDTGKSGNELEIESISDELQLSGDAMSGDLTYITGLYYQKMRSDTLWPQTYFAGAVTATNNFRVDTETQAIYGQATYSLSSDLRVTAGARYTNEDVTISQLKEADAYGAPDQDDSFSKPSWELGVEYDLSDTMFTYLKTRGSFRSGGFNGSAPPVNADATGGGNKFKAETVKDVEAGLKYQGDLFSRPARMNLAVYQEWVEDVQRIEFPDPPGPVQSIAVTANVPKMEVKGFELDGSIMPADWLELGLSGTYTDATFTDNKVVLFGTQYSYSPVANTPKTTWSVWVQVDFPIAPELGDINLRVEGYGQDKMYFSNTADSVTPETELPSYQLVNARLNWNNIMGSQFSAAVFGKNLTGEEYFVGGMPLGASLGHNSAAVGAPRMVGGEVSYKF